MGKGLPRLQTGGTLPLPDKPVVYNFRTPYSPDRYDIFLFPAIFRPSRVEIPPVLMGEGKAGCYQHPHLPAEAVCEWSGRMICQLCATEWEGQTVSVQALEEKLRHGGKDAFPRTSIAWDRIALVLAIAPLLIFYVTVITAPLALGIALWRHGKGVESPYRNNRWRFVAAGWIALVQIIGWLLIFVLPVL